MIDQETKTKLLKELEKTGNISVACLRVGVGRATYYHWIKFDDKFKKKAMSAMRHGRSTMVDLVENAMFNKAIKEKDFGAQKYILSHNLPRYKIDRSSEAYIHHNRKPIVEPPQGKDIHDYIHDVEKLATELAADALKKYQDEEKRKSKPIDDGTTGSLGP